MSLTADDLILFAHIAECGSFTAAAQRTGLPKSTLSRRISTLEATLGERLFKRSTRALTLTELGEGILHHGQRMLEEIKSVSELATHRQLTPAGQLRVSLPPATFQELSLLAILRTFVERYPQVQLELDVSPHRVDLHTGRFDLAVRIARQLPNDAALVARPLTTLPHGLYASPGYLARHGTPQTPSELTQHVGLPLITSDGQHQPWALSRGGETVEITPRGPVAANSVSLQSALAAEGTGIFGMSELFARPMVEQGLVQRVLPEWSLPTLTAWAVTQGRRLLPLHTRAFIEVLREHLGAAAAPPLPTPSTRPI